MKQQTIVSALAALAFVIQGCGGGGSTASASALSSVLPTPSPTATATATSGTSSVSLTALPIDDDNTTSSPQVSHIYSCQSTFNGGGAFTDGPWMDTAAGTFNLTTKIAVEGSVAWSSQLSNTTAGSTRSLVGNGLPTHTTGTYPIAANDPAYQYDRNPNSIAAQNVNFQVPLSPVVAAEPTCLNMGAIGIMLTGVQLYNALDAAGRDAVAHEVLDACDGHPDQSGTYHYHNMSACISDPGTGHSNLIGYARDGFGIYGMRGENGQTLTDADLDACHGHTHAIAWNGQTVVMYHYHMTQEYPYSLGCYAGTPQ